MRRVFLVGLASALRRLSRRNDGTHGKSARDPPPASHLAGVVERESGAVTREIEAIWQWHVLDKTSGECNRHGDGQRGCDFAMSGGEILRSFAFLYSQTKDPQWLRRTRLVADYYWRSRHPDTNLIPNRPNAGSQRFDGSHFDTSITGHLCPCLLDAAD